MDYYEEDILMHHGIKGQKWGIRRYQNPDGSLTEAGKKRYYNDDGSLTSAGKRWETVRGVKEITKKVLTNPTSKTLLKIGAAAAGAVAVDVLIGKLGSVALASSIPYAASMVGISSPMIAKSASDMAPLINQILGDSISSSEIQGSIMAGFNLLQDPAFISGLAQNGLSYLDTIK